MASERRYQRPARGFTLVELMIVLALVGTLVLLALPSYDGHLRRANRTQAIDRLILVSGAQERFLFTFGRYASSISAPPSNDPSTAGLGLSATTAEGAGDKAYYEIAVDVDADGLGYQIKAVPKGSFQAADACGTLTLRHTGQRGAAAPNCW